MKRILACTIAVILAGSALFALAAQKGVSAISQENRAIIVVTGMRVNEDPADYRKDLTVGEGATVKVTAQDGQARSKKTEPFAKTGKNAGQVHFTADFEVNLDATYTIDMTFKDGTSILIKDYRLPREWRTHFYFHSTNGTKSPASVLRFKEDEKSKQRCCVYAVFPLEAYRKLGGRQIP